MLVEHALRRSFRRIVRNTSLDHLSRLHQERLRIILIQQPPIAKVRKQVHEQPPSFRADGQLDVMVLHPLHDQPQHCLALFLADAHERDDGVQDRILEVCVLQARAELVALYQARETRVAFWGGFGGRFVFAVAGVDVAGVEPVDVDVEGFGVGFLEGDGRRLLGVPEEVLQEW